jgi:hypothetical protein
VALVWATRHRRRLGHDATSRTVAGSNPVEIIGFLINLTLPAALMSLGLLGL